MNNLNSPEYPELTPLVVYDFRVMAWLIHECIARQEVPLEKLLPYTKACWAMVLNRGPNAVDWTPHTAVVVDDNGSIEPYWRKQLHPSYKEGRAQKPDRLLSIAQIGLDYVNSPKSPLHYFSKPAYEADDFAGSLVYIKRLAQHLPSDDPGLLAVANRPLALYTVDSDWLQLVGQGVTWYNSGPWEPRVRDTEGALAWARKRLKVNLRDPHQIVDTKMKQGDKSDNLPPGTPRYMIDLLESHPQYHLRYDLNIWSQLWLVSKDLTPTQNIKHLESARHFMATNGLNFPV